MDDSGILPDGRRIAGATALADLLCGEQGFLRALVKNLLTYALGRGLLPSDAALVEELVDALGDEPTLGRLIRGIVRSDAFRRQGGEGESPR